MARALDCEIQLQIIYSCPSSWRMFIITPAQKRVENIHRGYWHYQKIWPSYEGPDDLEWDTAVWEGIDWEKGIEKN